MGFANPRATSHLAPRPTHHVATVHTDATALKVSSYCTVACATNTVNLAAPKDAAFPPEAATAAAATAATAGRAPPPVDGARVGPPRHPHGPPVAEAVEPQRHPHGRGGGEGGGGGGGDGRRGHAHRLWARGPRCRLRRRP